MDFKKLLEETWKTFMEFLPAMVISTLGLIGISLASLGFLAPVATAGYMQSMLLAVRDRRKPEIGDLFSQMRLFLPLLGFTIVVGIALFLGFLLLVLPGIIIALALTFFCVYMLPLMTDREMGLVDAVKESSRLAMQDPVVEHIVAVALYLGITAIGNSIILGVLFTQPFATLFMMSVYLYRAGETLSGPEETARVEESQEPVAEEQAPETTPEENEVAEETAPEADETKQEKSETQSE